MLFTLPLLGLFLFLVNVLSSPGEWWFQWAALGLGFAWVIHLGRVMRAVILAGGLAAFGAYLAQQRA